MLVLPTAPSPSKTTFTFNVLFPPAPPGGLAAIPNYLLFHAEDNFELKVITSTLTGHMTRIDITLFAKLEIK
jgi:hypothetical protein